MNPESIYWKYISNRINGFHALSCNHGQAKTQATDRTRLFRSRISTVTAHETLTNLFMTYYPIDFNTDMAKVPY